MTKESNEPKKSVLLPRYRESPFECGMVVTEVKRWMRRLDRFPVLQASLQMKSYLERFKQSYDWSRVLCQSDGPTLPQAISELLDARVYGRTAKEIEDRIQPIAGALGEIGVNVISSRFDGRVPIKYYKELILGFIDRPLTENSLLDQVLVAGVRDVYCELAVRLFTEGRKKVAEALTVLADVIFFADFDLHKFRLALNAVSRRFEFDRLIEPDKTAACDYHKIYGFMTKMAECSEESIEVLKHVQVPDMPVPFAELLEVVETAFEEAGFE